MQMVAPMHEATLSSPTTRACHCEAEGGGRGRGRIQKNWRPPEH